MYLLRKNFKKKERGKANSSLPAAGRCHLKEAVSLA